MIPIDFSRVAWTRAGSPQRGEVVLFKFPVHPLLHRRRWLLHEVLQVPISLVEMRNPPSHGPPHGPRPALAVLAVRRYSATKSGLLLSKSVCDNCHRAYMGFLKLSLYCTCGRAASRIKHVGLTADHQLVVGWWCSPCKRNVYVLKALSDCWRDCPKPIHRRQAVAPKPIASDPDARFLHRLGVKFPKEAES